MVVRYLSSITNHDNSAQISPAQTVSQTFFNRNELNQILSIYGKKISEGKLKDYAIDHLESSAVFSFFRHTFETAFLKIIKNKKISKSKLKYHLVSSAGSIIKRSNELELIIKHLNTTNLKIVKK
mgnify:FL=1|jgi:hypothetical protein|tara:strand:+ start:12503 stop:12877 length:375 start_codon:yes stop_codon:yes gene_type:complete